MKLTGLTWWIDRWRKSTAYTDMSLEEQGAYRNLLDEAWLRGGLLPFNDRTLAKASGDATRWPKVRARVLQWFVKTEDGWRNKTLDEVLTKSSQEHEWRSLAGKHGAAARWGNGKANSKPDGKGHSKPMDPDPDPDLLRKKSISLEGCAHSPKCLTKNDCRIRSRRAAGL